MKRISIVLVFNLLIALVACKKDDVSSFDADASLKFRQGNIPDFSFAGYMRNEVPIPFVKHKITLSPEEGTDRKNIQRAIDEIGSLALVDGFRGALLLKAGTYLIDSNIIINKSGIVIRGEGQGPNGTVLIDTRVREQNMRRISEKQRQSVFTLKGSTGYQVVGSESRIRTNFVDVGSKSIELASATGFYAGDTVSIVKTTNSHWINKLGMGDYGWTPDQYQIDHIRVISNVLGNVIYFDIPMVDQILDEDGGGKVMKVSFPGRISNSGIENMRLETLSLDEDETNTWTAVNLESVENCWVRNITAKYFAFSAVSLTGQSDYNTIQDCAMLEPISKPIGDRRYAFHIAMGSGNLFQRCYSDRGRHDFVTGARVAGPNVFLDSYAQSSLDETGPHHRWATGTLFDNIHASRIAARNRRASGSGHGWTGAFNMFWNCEATKGFYIESPIGAVNWLIGGKSKISRGDAYTAGLNLTVEPRSIFIDQLINRLGIVKANEVLTSKQLEGSVWDNLAWWSGGNNAIKVITADN